MPKHNKKSDKPAKARYNAENRSATNKARRIAKETRKQEKSLHVEGATKSQQDKTLREVGPKYYWIRVLNRAMASLRAINSAKRPNGSHHAAATNKVIIARAEIARCEQKEADEREAWKRVNDAHKAAKAA